MFGSPASSSSLPSWGQTCDGHGGRYWQWSTVLWGYQRWPLAWITSRQLPWQYKASDRGGGKRREKTRRFFFFSFRRPPYRWCRLCGWQRAVTCRKANQPLSAPRCHLLDTVTPANKLIKCVTATPSHTHTHTHTHRYPRKHTHVFPNQHLAAVWVTAAYTERTGRTQLSDRDAAFHNNAIKSYNNCLQEVSEAVMPSRGWRI